MRQQIPFLGDQSKNRIARINDQQTINFEPKLQKPNAKTTLSLNSTPGLSLISTAGDGACRSNWKKWNNDIYYVNGTKLIKVDSSNAVTTVGTILTTGGWCQMASGRNYLMLVDGLYGYTYDGTTFAQITDADFPSSPTHCAYLDSYFITNKGDSDRFYISDTENPTSWNPLNFATAEASPDDILAVGATNKDLYLFGETTTQPYYNSGNADFPFDPYQEVIQIGIHAKHSIARGVNGFFFLASNEDGDAFVVNLRGFQAQMVSDDELNWQINTLDSTTDAIGSLFRHNGTTWYELTFPQSDITYVLNVDTGGWHRRKSHGIGRHRASGFGYLNGKVLCGDYNNTNFYELDYNSYTDNGGVIERTRRTQVISVDQRDLIFHELVLDMETGVGLNTGQGSDPIIIMRYSDDGKTWSNWLSASVGKIGEYKTRAKWMKLGASPNRTFEIQMSDPVSCQIFNAYADVEVLPY